MRADQTFCATCGTPASRAGAAVAGGEVVAESAPVPASPPTPSVAHDVPGPTPSGAPPLPVGVPGWWRSRRLRLASRASVALALLGVGVLVGWAAGSDRSLVTVEAPRPTASAGVRRVDPAQAVMPDVRGLSAGDARQVLSDAGVIASAVSSTDQPAAGEAGLVLTQDPVYGYPVDDQVRLTVSVAATVPTFAGRDADAVLADLEDLGTEVTTRAIYTPGVTVGAIVSIDPAPGTALPESVQVILAAQPDQRALSQVSAIDDVCYADSGSIDGTSYDDLLTCSAERPPTVQTWLLKRAAVRLTGKVGIPDSGTPGDSATVEVLADGRLVDTLTVAYGTATPLDLDVTGVLRLSLRFRAAGGDYPVVGLGGLRVLGDAGALGALDQS